VIFISNESFFRSDDGGATLTSISTPHMETITICGSIPTIPASGFSPTTAGPTSPSMPDGHGRHSTTSPLRSSTRWKWTMPSRIASTFRSRTTRRSRCQAA
jgi:hypothetical protein